jgi:hypothetical protein
MKSQTGKLQSENPNEIKENDRVVAESGTVRLMAKIASSIYCR